MGGVAGLVGGLYTAEAQATSLVWLPPFIGCTNSTGGEVGLKGENGPVNGRLESVNTILSMLPASRGRFKVPCFAVRSPALQASGMSLLHSAGS